MCNVTMEVSEAIVEVLREESVNKYMPHSDEEFCNNVVDMEEMWQFLAAGQQSMAVISHLNALQVDLNLVRNTTTSRIFIQSFSWRW